MSSRPARCALILFLAAAAPAIAAETDAVPAQDVERMTPAQLRALQAKLDRADAATRGENASLSRRIEALERRNAADAAKRAELDAQLARVREQLASLEASRDD